MPEQFRRNIRDKLIINPTAYNADLAQQLVLQIEAHFVFAIFKSVLASQKEDPFIKSLLLNNKITLDSPALCFYNCKVFDPKDL